MSYCKNWRKNQGAGYCSVRPPSHVSFFFLLVFFRLSACLSLSPLSQHLIINVWLFCSDRLVSPALIHPFSFNLPFVYYGKKGKRRDNRGWRGNGNEMARSLGKRGEGTKSLESEGYGSWGNYSNPMNIGIEKRGKFTRISRKTWQKNLRENPRGDSRKFHVKINSIFVTL